MTTRRGINAKSTGFFEIGIYHCKTEMNSGTLWRTAYQLGAAGIFIIGTRFKRQNSDTVNAFMQIPMREYEDFESFSNNRPYDCQLVGVEIDGEPLSAFKHPARAIYLLGAEDNGLPRKILDRCQHVVEIESMRAKSFNVAISGAIVMYHRLVFVQGK